MVTSVYSAPVIWGLDFFAARLAGSWNLGQR